MVATAAVETGEVEAAVVVGIEAEVVADEDMIEQEQSDTKVLGARVLPVLGRRL